MNPLRRNRVHIRRNLDLIIDRNPAELPAEQLGLDPAATQAIHAALLDLYRTGLHPGLQLCVRRRGEILYDRAIGYAAGVAGDDPLHGARRPMQRDTPVCLFSASKAVTAMLVHKCAEDGLVDLDARVTDYLPEYGVNGKEQTLVRHLLAHQAGIPRIPMREPDPSLLWDWERAVAMLCAAKPLHGAGEQQAYHAVTAGFILGELVQRVSGKPLNDYLAEHFARPMGMKTFQYGLPRERHHEAARNAFTGAPLPAPLRMIARRVLGADFERVPGISNCPEFLSAVIPAGNLYATAEEATSFFEMLRVGGRYQGRQLLAPETVARAVEPASRIRIDRSLMLPVRFSMGMVLGENPFGLYGPNCRGAFGHLGFMNIICWADPSREISVAILNTGKTVAPSALYRLGQLLRTIGTQIPRDAPEAPALARAV
ncbi:serine hydrolase domain-containing protein [Algiphilus aromaticivorans]|uniref:serine hydrolase domain-containing protein n=1 Tax=Algiphilus aromaticivorans TaxID=382454 RepID=UPI0005C19DC9|nr:serine hydrolase domain-containing protein [Algiphilus aromaticivorans]